MTRKVLLIVEGEHEEPSFIKRLFKTCSGSSDYITYSYRTNIHIIAQELYNNYNDFDKGDTDIRLVLASKEDKDIKKKVLLDTYSDIFMIFDFEPQHDNPHFDTIRRMINYYNDSTNQGKLFINYPMMQSYKHFDKLPCYDFEDIIVKEEDFKEYKKIVASISFCTDLEKYNYITFLSIAIHHLKKANMIVNNIYNLPSINEYLKLDYVEIFDKQLVLLSEKGYVYVLNTCIFILFDFSPKKLFNYIDKHAKELLI